MTNWNGTDGPAYAQKTVAGRHVAISVIDPKKNCGVDVVDGKGSPVVEDSCRAA
ncbi:hypothetical protein PLEOSDRAFT_1072916 [Pleurotus ostreatus PC15]|uniref:Uncharacterized protein n=1 Tax=Pleurotus ostreatus (strain PC15) TaxID=1137138 RepID=A0A067NFG0_PLEO1|nr:hypothetical protein PLEOSDRAFT_1072916 [Pleurotus ostreatus PC15]